jgi:hypothetical protein
LGYFAIFGILNRIFGIMYTIDFYSSVFLLDLIYTSMKFLSPETSDYSTYYYRDYSRIHTALLMRDVASLNWSPIYSTSNVMSRWHFLTIPSCNCLMTMFLCVVVVGN